MATVTSKSSTTTATISIKSNTSSTSASASSNATEYYSLSAKNSAELAAEYAELAKDWANKTPDSVDGEEYSAKYYAESITDTAEETIASITEAGTNALSDIADAQTNAVEAIETAQSNAETVISEGTTSIETSLTSALSDITEAETNALSEIEEAKTTSVNYLTGRSYYNFFCVNTGDTTDEGEPAFLELINGSKLTTSGEFDVTTAAGKTYTISDTLTLDITDYEEGTYNVYVNPVDLTLSVISNTLTYGITFPDDAADGDYLLNTAKVSYDLQKINITTDEDTEETTTTITTGLNEVYAGTLVI